MFFKKEKKYDIGILSFNMNTLLGNFGVALHSYAFQKYLDKKNINNVIINYKTSNPINNYIKFLKKYKIKFIPHILNAIKKDIYIKSFFKKNCTITKNKYTNKTIKNLKSINRFCIETDVTWALTKNGKFNEIFMCAPKNMKNKDNIAYSVDFGSHEFNKNQESELANHSKNFKYISIRNIFKLDYIKQVTQRNDIVITIDPVFLLDKNDYLKITQKPKIKDKYILIYNCKENHPQMLKTAKNFAKKNNFKTITINCYDKNIKTLKDDNPTPTKIEEFLGYINNCEYLFTNSYHGICFSIIFNKQFFAFSRTGNNEKILTILELFKLHNRFTTDELPNNKINWEEVNNLWKKHKIEAEKFINKSIINNQIINKETEQ